MGSVTEYYRTVQTILTQIKSDTLREFSLLTTDEQRVAYVMKLDAVKHAFCIEPRYSRKSASGAKSHREAGNKLYKDKNFAKALVCYNNSVLYAPWPRTVPISNDNAPSRSFQSGVNNSDNNHRSSGQEQNNHLPSQPSSVVSSRQGDYNTIGNHPVNNDSRDDNNTVVNAGSETSDYTSVQHSNQPTGNSGASETSDYISEAAKTFMNSKAMDVGGNGISSETSDYISEVAKPINKNTVISNGGGLSETSDYISETSSTTSSQFKIYSKNSSKSASIITQGDSLLPQTDPEFNELPLALGNRSATLCQLAEYGKCIEDIDLALKLGFPLHLRYKLFDRKARCLIEGKKYEEAILYFERVKTSLVASNLTMRQREKVVVNCEKQIASCKEALSKNCTQNNEDTNVPKYVEMVVPLIENKNVRFPYAAQGFEVRYKEMKGRYGVASQAFKTGDVVISEGPYTSVLEAGQYDKRCYHCFVLLPLSPFSCQSCSGVKYCSSKCREISWDSSHRWECHYLGMLQASGTGVLAHLALTTVFKGGWSNIIKCKKNHSSQKHDPTKSLFTNKHGVFMGGFASLYNLLPHTESRVMNELFQYTILSIFLLKIAKYSDFFDEISQLSLKEKENLNGAPDVILGGTLLRFLQIISCNGIEVTEMVIGTNLQNTNPEPIGLALYPTVSLLNHSCNPAMELVFYNNQCVVRPIRSIQTTSELSIDYGYLYYVTGKEQRQTNLRSQYHFRCDCEACVLNWPMRNELGDGIPPLKCIYCQVPLMLYGNNNPLEVTCENCGILHNPIDYFQMLRDSSKECDAKVERARMFEIKEAIPAIERHIALLEEYIIMPWKEYTVCVSTLKQCYRMLGNVSRDVSRQLKLNRLRFDT